LAQAAGFFCQFAFKREKIPFIRMKIQSEYDRSPQPYRHFAES